MYGVILTVTGFLDGSSAVHKAEGVRINLWTGLVTLLVAAVFLVWERVRPTDGPESHESPENSEDGPISG
ncbi:hypothetical protein [Planotetraspora kaengkrachanensis]|uniref:Uncharacterized protein n=1 Tax=Planotetraspora kaengkrachanensis TaxID=575193 RepID=A0A8J3PQV0_9ACTN|nr:hypothetical protein [Planotetraspora kaengkrachanensis]GIG77298.1 hypothetical protein Pka01_04250 [Planotetraspora kaengkrachanensis]